MAGLAWEVLSCNGIRNYKLDSLSHRHYSTLLTLAMLEVLYFNKLSKTVLQKIKFNYYRKAIKHHFCFRELETQAYKYFFCFLNIEKLKIDIFKNEFRICIFVIFFFRHKRSDWLKSVCFWIAVARSSVDSILWSCYVMVCDEKSNNKYAYSEFVFEFIYL